MKTRVRAAFTLMELMVAMAVTSLLVILMLQIFNSGTAAWQSNEERLDTFREARAALQIMGRDFSTLSPAPSADEQFPVLMLDWHRDTPPEDRVNREIYGLVTTRNKGIGDLCAVGYYCEWDGKNKFVLKRQFSDSDNTFDRLKQVLTANATTPQSPRMIFETLFARIPGDPRKPTNVQSIQVLASHVWDLQVDMPDPLNPERMVPWTTAPGSFNRNLPPWVEIRFKALGTNAARKIPDATVGREDWYPPPPASDGTPASGTSSAKGAKTFYERYILPYEQQFVTRLKLSQ